MAIRSIKAIIKSKAVNPFFHLYLKMTLKNNERLKMYNVTPPKKPGIKMVNSKINKTAITTININNTTCLNFSLNEFCIIFF
jgi:CRISPR/Cas system CMR-associated protein Cmr3 (group 5 of RAMP superfamily)